MEFPKTNKLRQSLEAAVGENAALLQELLESIQWRRFLNYYVAFLGIFLISLFLIIVTVRFAMWLF